MLYIIHRVNKTKELAKIPSNYGVEVDVRGFGDKLILSHDIVKNPDKCENLANYLKHFKHAFIIFNIKTAGYEDQVIALAKKFKIQNYFLLDVEFPYLYNATRTKHFKKIAVRFSEAEPIENVEAQVVNHQPLLDWVWIDTNTQLPLNRQIITKLSKFKTCLVCPSRWGRPENIKKYAQKIIKLNFKLTAIMTTLKYAKIWQAELKKSSNKQ